MYIFKRSLFSILNLCQLRPYQLCDDHSTLWFISFLTLDCNSISITFCMSNATDFRINLVNAHDFKRSFQFGTYIDLGKIFSGINNVNTMAPNLSRVFWLSVLVYWTLHNINLVFPYKELNDREIIPHCKRNDWYWFTGRENHIGINIPFHVCIIDSLIS